MNLDNALWLGSIATVGALLGLLVFRRTWQTLPTFFVYCVWDLLSNAGAFAIHYFDPALYSVHLYIVQTVVDFAFQLGVLVELAWSVFRPVRNLLSGRAILVAAAVVLVLSGAIWPFSALGEPAFPIKQWNFLFQMQHTASILRILFFLSLSVFSQLLSIGWRDRELQVATGFGLYSIVSLGVTIEHSYRGSLSLYRNLNELVVLSYLCSLIYWVFCFSQKEAVRREFTPQMQHFLLALAGSARSTRATLTSCDDKPGNQAEQ